MNTPEGIEMPAPTAWPAVMAFGLTLVFAGLVTAVPVSILGAILAVAGAVGWFREVLLLGYQCKNVCVDTSGTNNWLDSFVPKMTLSEVFDATFTALGPERILFGTDSSSTAPYRKWIAFSQRRILEELGASDRDRDLVLRGNAARIFGL